MNKIIKMLSLLFAGIVLINSENIVSAEELDMNDIYSEITSIDGVFIETILIPNEFVDEWEEYNLPEVDSFENSNIFELQNVSPMETSNLGGFTTFAASPPLFTYWNVSTQGQYNYSGSFRSVNALYTNYAFTGASRHFVKIQNTGSSTAVIAEARDRVFKYSEMQVPVGYSMYMNVTTSKSFYMKFHGVSGAGSVSGWVRDLDEPL